MLHATCYMLYALCSMLYAMLCSVFFVTSGASRIDSIANCENNACRSSRATSSTSPIISRSRCHTGESSAEADEPSHSVHLDVGSLSTCSNSTSSCIRPTYREHWTIAPARSLRVTSLSQARTPIPRSSRASAPHACCRANGDPSLRRQPTSHSTDPEIETC